MTQKKEIRVPNTCYCIVEVRVSILVCRGFLGSKTITRLIAAVVNELFDQVLINDEATNG